jgi:hypothetical protein
MIKMKIKILMFVILEAGFNFMWMIIWFFNRPIVFLTQYSLKLSVIFRNEASELKWLLKYCYDDCIYLNITEKEQCEKGIRAPHKCMKYLEELKHYGSSKLYRCKKCRYIRKKNGK